MKFFYAAYLKQMNENQAAGEAVEASDVISELVEALTSQVQLRTSLKESIIKVFVESIQ